MRESPKRTIVSYSDRPTRKELRVPDSQTPTLDRAMVLGIDKGDLEPDDTLKRHGIDPEKLREELLSDGMANAVVVSNKGDALSVAIAWIGVALLIKESKIDLVVPEGA
jgi:hypothetical protein